MEEDKLKVVWSAADIEVWLKSGRKISRQKDIVVDSYEVTIFPAESVNNTHTVPALGAGPSAIPVGELLREHQDEFPERMFERPGFELSV